MVTTSSVGVQSETFFSDLNTIVLIANASLFNLRIEMPIYTNESQAEIAKVLDFKAALNKMGLKRFVQDEHFDMIVSRLSVLDCIIEPGLINV